MRHRLRHGLWRCRFRTVARFGCGAEAVFFDREVRRLTREWLAAQRGELAELAQMNFNQLQREFGAVLGLSTPANFKIPYPAEIEPPESYRDGLARLYPGYRFAPGWRVRRIELSPAHPLDPLTNKDLVLRHYDRRETQRVPATFLRYARAQEALSA